MENSVDYVAMAGITTALVEILKKIDVKSKFERFYPLVSLIVGFSLGTATGFPWIISLTVGLTASGLYSQVKTLAGK